MEMKKVLLFTGKLPCFGEDTDGGSLMVHTLIDALKDKCILDVIFTRTPRLELEHIEGVRRVKFEPYQHHPVNKFERRLINRDQLLTCLRDKANDYGCIIITHCSKAFGIETLPEDIQRKIIIFPMYLSPSYERSGENPPKEYIEAERNALVTAFKILTPSISEKNDMVRYFGVDDKKITVIPRGISSYIRPVIKTVGKTVKLLYIASVKEQKNTLDAIVLLNKLCAKGVNAELHLAGGFQNDDILAECRKYIDEQGLGDKVIFHGVLSQKELSELINDVHINISVSNWETYGRGIYEGMAGALPTVVYDRLECVKQNVQNGKGIRFVRDHNEFLSELMLLYDDPVYYRKQAEEAVKSVEYLSEEYEKKRLVKELI